MRCNYKIFSERLDEYDGEIFTTIISSITDKDTRMWMSTRRNSKQI